MPTFFLDKVFDFGLNGPQHTVPNIVLIFVFPQGGFIGVHFEVF